jgi:hypothetical protein
MQGLSPVAHNILTTFLTWIITNVSGVFIFAIIVFLYHGGANDYVSIILPCSSLCSIPGMIIYHIIRVMLYKIIDKPWIIKIILSFLAIMIVAVTITIFFYSLNPNNLSDPNSLFPYIMIYSVPFIICILLFKQKG